MRDTVYDVIKTFRFKPKSFEDYSYLILLKESSMVFRLIVNFIPVSE